MLFKILKPHAALGFLKKFDFLFFIKINSILLNFVYLQLHKKLVD